MSNTQTAPGKVLQTRTDGKIVVELIYWGKDADPKLTVSVVELNTDLEYWIHADDANIVDAFNHPLTGYWQDRKQPVNTDAIYA